jgi:catechol 2,3-dioxygenase-like lactoylglutathione lyase family enzyme
MQRNATRTDVLGYAHVNVVVTDLEAAREFYGGKLGLETIPRPDFGGFSGEWYALGASQLHLSVAERMPEWNGTAPHLALYLAPETFVESVQRLVDAGVELTSPVRSREDFGVTVQTAFCRDPAGNLIELTDVAPLG